MDTTTTRTVTPNSAKASIKHAISKKRPIFLWGPPGIGKSDIVNKLQTALTLMSLTFV